MARPNKPVTRLRQRNDADELARLKRLTGLDWERVPESLLDAPDASAEDPDTRVKDRGTPRSRPLAG